MGVSENVNASGSAIPLVNGHFIVGMLSTPHLELLWGVTAKQEVPFSLPTRWRP